MSGILIIDIRKEQQDGKENAEKYKLKNFRLSGGTPQGCTKMPKKQGKKEEKIMKTREIRQEYLTGERALFQGENLKIYDSIFADGESPLKESHDIELEGCMFK